MLGVGKLMLVLTITKNPMFKMMAERFDDFIHEEICIKIETCKINAAINYTCKNLNLEYSTLPLDYLKLYYPWNIFSHSHRCLFTSHGEWAKSCFSQVCCSKKIFGCSKRHRTVLFSISTIKRVKKKNWGYDSHPNSSFRINLKLPVNWQLATVIIV